jgi:hypothetical protein
MMRVLTFQPPNDRTELELTRLNNHGEVRFTLVQRTVAQVGLTLLQGEWEQIKRAVDQEFEKLNQ